MMRRWLLVGHVLFWTAALRGEVIRVSAGQSIQKAIDAAPAGATIQIAPGVFQERLDVDKPLTLEGAGWQQTTIKPDGAAKPHSDAEKIAFADNLEAATDERQQLQIVNQFLGRDLPPTIVARATEGAVVLSKMKIQGISPGTVPGSGSEAIVRFDRAKGQLLDCAVVGPSNGGVEIIDGADVQIRDSLIAAVWDTGLAVKSSRNADPSKVQITGCDIRNCYYAGVVIGGEGSTIDHCRISGAAWHGIRYDDCSPTITNNSIFGNARCGIYASGNTHAVIRSNTFWKNEMDAISCWFNNADTIENNTIVGNLREGIEVLGDAKPHLSHNILADNPVAVECAMIAGQGDAVGSPELEQNWFWNNKQDMEKSQKAAPAPPGSGSGDPHFTNSGQHDYSLVADSPARAVGVGATMAVPAASGWPIQPEETAIIPSSDTRDWNQWKKPSSLR